MTEIIVGGDICPINRSIPYFQEGDAVSIFGDLLETLQNSDLAIANLECPLIERQSPINKSGPVLGVDSACVKALSSAGINVLNLANNHILDHGPDGLENTLSVCGEAGISTVGAGRNLSEAGRILVRKVGNIRIGILGIADHEFSIAGPDSFGANPIDVIDFVRTVRDQRDTYDYLLVLLHGGNEGYPFPSPSLQKVCRFLVEEGANAVICQHSHIAGCYEKYRDGFIVYGQGNLVFDYPNQARHWHEGFLVRLTVNDDLSSDMTIVPFFQFADRIGVRFMTANEEKDFRRDLQERCRLLENSDYVEQSWISFCESRRNNYLSKLLGHNRLFRHLNRRGHLVKYMYTKKSLTALHNIIRCEAHKNVVLTILDREFQKTS